jgi:hypothetical protein
VLDGTNNMYKIVFLWCFHLVPKKTCVLRFLASAQLGVYKHLSGGGTHKVDIFYLKHIPSYDIWKSKNMLDLSITLL